MLISKDPLFKNGLKAIRVKQLAANTVQFEVLSSEVYSGLVDKITDKNNGIIRFEFKNGQAAPTTRTITFSISTEAEQVFYVGDKVQFNLSTCIKTKKQTAANVKLLEACKEQGFVATLRDSYGIIELHGKKSGGSGKTAPREIVFYLTNKPSSTNEFEVGDEVEFAVNRTNALKVCAESLVKLKSGTLKPNVILQVYLRFGFRA